MIHNIKVTTLTPVHIGSGRKFPMNIEVIYDGDRIGIISPEKVIGKIRYENITRWIASIENRENIWEFLQRYGVSSIKDVCSRTMVVFGSDIARKKDVKEQLISARGNPLLPGSSIKGSIRTAILSHLISELPNVAQREIEDYKKKKPAYKWNLHDYQSIESRITHRYFNGKPKQDANSDVLRFLHVTDAEFPFETIATNVRILNLEHDSWKFKHRGDQITEAIGVESDTKVRIKINDQLLKINMEMKNISDKLSVGYLDSIEKLFEIISSHTSKLVKKEINFWEWELAQTPIGEIAGDPLRRFVDGLKELQSKISELKGQECILRIGGNSGWDFITGAWIKTEDNLLSDEEWERLYRMLNKNRNVDVYPKTRKLDEDGDFFGFVKLEVID